MAESSPLRRSLCQGSDQIPDTFCGPCHDITSEIKPAAGYCINCDDSLCKECYDFHLRTKPFRNHQLQVVKPTKPKSKVTVLDNYKLYISPSYSHNV